MSHPEAAERFRQYLNAEYKSLKEKRPNYSIRAFANKLGMDSSYLSKLLSGRQQLSEKMMRRLAETLCIEKAEYLQILIGREPTKLQGGSEVNVSVPERLIPDIEFEYNLFLEKIRTQSIEFESTNSLKTLEFRARLN